MMKKCLLLLFCFLPVLPGNSQENAYPEVPVLSGYQGNAGVITKYNFFNFLTLTDQSGENNRQSTGQYWEVSYIYDSAFRQKDKFADFAEKLIVEKGGTLYFRDTSSIHFAVPDSGGNLWGKILLTSNSVYKLRLIKEKPFENTVVMDSPAELTFDDYVIPVELPPRLGFLPNSIVTRADQSKFNHYSFTYTTDNKTYRQKLMGPYWDLKMEIQDENGEVDKRVSFVQVQESYYRAVMKAGGNIVKNRARELIFNLPGDDFTVWGRLMATMDGVYFIRIIQQFPADYQGPELIYGEDK